MNGYWDALLGAALGLPGTARPGPGPRLLVSGDDDGPPIEMEELRDAPPPAPALPPAPPRVASSAEARPAVAAEPEAPAPPSPARAEPAPRPFEPAPSPVAAEPRTVREIETILPSEARARVERPARATAPPPPADPRAPAVEPARAAPPPTVEPPAAVAAPASPVPIEERRAQPASATSEPAPAEPVTIAAEPLAAPAAWSEKDEEAPAPLPLLTVEIGRIDVRIVAPTPAAPPLRPVPRAADAVPSLADYLARRSEAGR